MEHHTKLLQFRAPESLSEAIDAAAKREFQTKSEYVRRSVIDRLRADSIKHEVMLASISVLGGGV
jgi:predicted DNA-binding protein